MTFKPTAGQNKRAVIDKVLKNYPKISTAPRSLSAFQQFFLITDPVALAKFEERMEVEEAKKLYKAVDNEGNVFLIPNPWRKAERPKPELKFTYEEACAEAGRSYGSDAPRENKRDSMLLE